MRQCAGVGSHLRKFPYGPVPTYGCSSEVTTVPGYGLQDIVSLSQSSLPLLRSQAAPGPRHFSEFLPSTSRSKTICDLYSLASTYDLPSFHRAPVSPPNFFGSPSPGVELGTLMILFLYI